MLISCGVSMYMAPRLQKVGRCFDALRQKTGLWNSIKKIAADSVAEEGNVPPWVKTLSSVCEFAGGMLAEAVKAVLSGGGSTGPAVARSIRSIVKGIAEKALKAAKDLPKKLLEKAKELPEIIAKKAWDLANKEMPNECR
jgi:hypothetical protein